MSLVRAAAAGLLAVASLGFLAGLLLVTSVALARAVGDAGAGAVIGSVAMLYGFAGGATLTQGQQALLDVEPPQYAAGFAVLFFVALLGFIGIADRTHYFVAGVTVGLLGFLGALIALIDGTTMVDVAAILVSVVIIFTPMVPLLSIRLGKLPMPTLPTTVDDLLADPPVVPLSRVHSTVRRTDELMTGMLLGGSFIVALAEVVLIMSGDVGPFILVAIVALATLLRGRLFPAVRHRAPLLVAGIIGVLAIAAGYIVLSPDSRLSITLPVIIFLAGLVLAAGFVYQNRPPTPYMGRIADIFDVLLVIAVVPTACAVLGLYGYLRGLGG